MFKIEKDIMEDYSDCQEIQSNNSSFLKFEHNKLPKIKRKINQKKKIINSQDNRIINTIFKNNNINGQKYKYKSPTRDFHKTQTHVTYHNKKHKSPIYFRKKTDINDYLFKDYKTQKSFYIKNSENTIQQNSSSKYFNVFSTKSLNAKSFKTIRLIDSKTSNINNNNHRRSKKRKPTLNLEKENEINLDDKYKLILSNENNIFNFNSESSLMKSSDELFNEDNSNSLSKIHLDLDYNNNTNNYNLINNSQITENHDDEEYDKYSMNSNKIKNGRNVYLIQSKNSIDNLKSSFHRTSSYSKVLTSIKSPLKKKANSSVKFHQNNNLRKNIKDDKSNRRMSLRSPHKNKTGKNKEIIIVSDILNDYHTIIRRLRRENSIIQRPFVINVGKYLEKERKKIQKILNESLKKNCIIEEKKNYLEKVIYKSMNDKFEKFKFEKNNEKEDITNIKVIMSSIFSNNFLSNKNLEYFEKEIDEIKNLNQKKILPNLHHISNNFFDCYSFIVYYIFDGQYKEKKNNVYKRSSIINNFLKVLEVIQKVVFTNLNKKKKFSHLNVLNHRFINIFYINDFPVTEIEDNDFGGCREHTIRFLKSRKMTRKRKRKSIQDLIHKSEKLNLNEETNKNQASNEAINYKNLLNQFIERDNKLNEWNILKKKSMYEIKLEYNVDEEEKKRIENYKKRKKFYLKLKWKRDMEILKSLGGDPVSKHCALMRTQELESENSNQKNFEQLLNFIDKSQTELFFSQFINLRFTDVNYQEKYTGDTLLIRATKTYNIYIITFLLEKGSNINIQNLELNTALHYAFMYNRVDLISLLISNGADENILNKKGYTPWECLKN